jgi:hypothetical protein
VDGVCTDLVCEPDSKYCSGKQVRQCAADGLSFTVPSTCTATQFCDAADATCKAQICTPNALGCDGNAVATCNANGSAFRPGGTSCGAKRCVNGACTDALLADDFEDGNSDGWTTGVLLPLYTTITTSVVSTTAASGTTYSYQLSATSTLLAFGAYATHPVPTSTPSSASFWVRAPSAASSCTLGFGGITVGFGSAGTFTGTGASPAPYAANRWYHFEIGTIDWTGGTYTVRIDGAVAATGVTFTPVASGTVTAVRLNTTPPAAGGTMICLFDEITIR